MTRPNATVQRNLRKGTQTASFWLDESGSRTTARDCFVVAGIKTRHADQLQREVKAIRDAHQSHTRELKFGRIDGGGKKIYEQAIELLADSDVRLVAAVVNGATFNPFSGVDPWRAHAHVIGAVVHGNVNRNEVVTVMVDGITTPPDVAMGQVIKRDVNGRIGAPTVIDAVSLDSKSNDLLQLADLVAGSIFYQRRKGPAGGPNELKTKISMRLARAFGQVNFIDDVRTGRLNIVTLNGPSVALDRSKTGTSTRGRGARR